MKRSPFMDLPAAALQLSQRVQSHLDGREGPEKAPVEEVVKVAGKSGVPGHAHSPGAGPWKGSCARLQKSSCGGRESSGEAGGRGREG